MISYIADNLNIVFQRTKISCNRIL